MNTRKKESNFPLLGVCSLYECVWVIVAMSWLSLGMALRENILAGIAVGEAEGWMGAGNKQTCSSKESFLCFQEGGRAGHWPKVRLWAMLEMGCSMPDI